MKRWMDGQIETEEKKNKGRCGDREEEKGEEEKRKGQKETEHTEIEEKVEKRTGWCTIGKREAKEK